MKGGTRIAVGVGIGYVLGRTRKMRFALALAGAAMAKRSSGAPAELLGRGASLLKSSPELTRLTDTVRGELAGAVRTAAVTAASNRIDALNARLQQGSTLVLDEGRDESPEADSDEGEYYDEPTREDEQASADEAEDEDLEDEDDSGRSHDEDDSGQPAARTRARRTGTAGGRKTGSRTAARSSGSADRKPASAVRRRSRSDPDEAPVRRARR
ncbi:hypothetical protein [Nocardia rhizosphaerihabitans]|uniref:DNA primase n=1 Tax=Nocardia rhizosphaerihabitans TaxID=1691570 RepID=A0ABQ2K4N5_9NOCA|nr:hypothetical protein [Nocardia rhizosphaerihabitans]GGN68707.1 hypothetical protein GCM10011610_06180 [Nocardia rhizosphaerihabitans]